MTQHAKTRKPAKRATPDTVAFLDDLLGGEADWGSLVEKARVNRDVAHALYDLRTAHGLTQAQLAELAGTKQPVIARLEDADYEGHSLSMLSRIAAALHQRVKVEFVPLATLAPRRPAAAHGAERPRRAVHVPEDTGPRAGARAGAPARKSASTTRTAGAERRGAAPTKARQTGAVRSR